MRLRIRISKTFTSIGFHLREYFLGSISVQLVWVVPILCNYLSWLHSTMTMVARLPLSVMLPGHSKFRLFAFGLSDHGSKANFTTTGSKAPQKPSSKFHFNPGFYSSLLQGCADMKSLEEGKRLHGHIVLNGWEQDAGLGVKLIGMYAKCGRIVDARQVFDRMSERNAFSWTAIIGGYARYGHCEEAFALFRRMYAGGLKPDSFVITLILPACANLAALQQGKEIHNYIIKTGFESNVFVGSCLLDMYSKCGSLLDARHVFDKLADRNAVSWTAMIASCAQNGYGDEALKLFSEMQLAGIKPNLITWNTMISGCAQNGQVDEASKQFQQMQLSGLEPDVVSWNALIGGYTQNGRHDEALTLIRQMHSSGVKPNSITVALVLAACAHLGALPQGKEVHGYIIRRIFDSNVFVGSALVDMYAKCRNLEDGRRVFDKISQRDTILCNAMIAGYAYNGNGDEALKLFRQMQLAGIKQNVNSWNAMIAGYSQNDQGEEAFELFHQMQLEGEKPNSISIVSILPVCAHMAALHHGKGIHAYIVKSGFESDVFVTNALIDMYAKCREVEDARFVFDGMSQRDIVSWNAMIACYAHSGYSDEALKLVCQMQLTGVLPNLVTILNAIPACSNPAFLQQGREIHCYTLRSGFESDVFVGSAIVDMYAKSGNIESARKVFDKVSPRDVVLWNAMIAGCAQNGQGEEAFNIFHQMQLAGLQPNVISWTAMIAGYTQIEHSDDSLKIFHQMQLAGMKPNSITISSVLPAVACLTVLQVGMGIHNYTIKSGYESNIFVGNALINMYAKCGNIDDALLVFENMSERDVVSWNALISGYAVHGHGEEAIALFCQLQQAGIKPNHITFTGVLSACSRAGLVDEGWKFFGRMSQEYCITPCLEHYACMVDLLGRAGHLSEAQNFISNMPVEPNASVWGALLGACRMHCNVELGEHGAEHLFVLEPENAGNYVLLSNIYAVAGRWHDAAKMISMMKEKGLKKKPGCSWIELKNQVHVFLVGGRPHPQAEKICTILESLAAQMEEARYGSD